MSGPVLPEHQTETTAAAAAAQTPTGSDVEEKNGQHAEGGAAGWRATGRACGWTSITRKQWHHGTEYTDIWGNATPYSPDPNSDHASSPTAGNGPRTWSPTATAAPAAAAAAAARWDALTRWHASSAHPSPPVSADGRWRWRWWGWGDNEFSPTSTADASSGPAAAAKWSRDQPSAAPTAPQQFASVWQQTPGLLPNPPVPGQTCPWLCNASPAAAWWHRHGWKCWRAATS